MNNRVITIFYSSREIGGRPDPVDLWPVCPACEKALGIKSEDKRATSVVPPEAMPLVFSAEQAALELGFTLELVDINQLPFVQRMKLKLQGIPIPSIKIGDDYIDGSPTKDEIVYYLSN